MTPAIGLLDGELTKMTLEPVQVYEGDEPPTLIGEGTLHLTTKRVIFVGSNGDDLKLTYPQIIVHAVQRDLSEFPHPALYCQLMNGNDEEELPPQLRFVPEDSEALLRLFEVMNDCSALNPDPEDDMMSDDDIAETEVGVTNGWTCAPGFDPSDFFGCGKDQSNGFH